MDTCGVFYKALTVLPLPLFRLSFSRLRPSWHGAQSYPWCWLIDESHGRRCMVRTLASWYDCRLPDLDAFRLRFPRRTRRNPKKSSPDTHAHPYLCAIQPGKEKFNCIRGGFNCGQKEEQLRCLSRWVKALGIITLTYLMILYSAGW